MKKIRSNKNDLLNYFIYDKKDLSKDSSQKKYVEDLIKDINKSK